ncbi:hypothetical protein RCH27_08860 [Paracidovorax citrulli]|uniref:hypothetical protein n=1 Tax=Paracidovorax citrulli TaxID=80869 RepID=UPI003A803248
MSTDTTLAPCPFCGGAMWVQSNRDWHRLFGDHDDDCVWGQDDDAVMMVPAQPDQLAAMVHAWNRRATISAPPQYPPMPEHWAVVASVNGQDILCITNDALAGSGELSGEEEQAVIGMAQHLLAFVGYGMPPCDFDPDER